MTKSKFKIHPLFIVFAAFLGFTGQWQHFVLASFCVLLHELGHFIYSRRLGYSGGVITLMPYGAVLTMGRLHPDDELKIALIGPVVNIILAMLGASVILLFDSVAYGGLLRMFVRINLTLFAFNMLPAYPLDGALIALSFCKNRGRALKNLRRAGILISFIFLILFIISIFIKQNLSMLLTAILIFGGAIYGTDNELLNIANDAFIPGKDYIKGVEHKLISISAEAPVSALYRYMNIRTEVDFCIVDEQGHEITVLSEARARALMLTASDKRIKDFL